MKKKNITININRLTDKVEIHTDSSSVGNSSRAKASPEEFIHKMNTEVDKFLSGLSRDLENRRFNVPQKQTLPDNSLKGLINVQDFQKLHVNEWLRLVHMLDSLLPEKELRVLYLQLLALKETDRSKILRKGARRMIQLSVQKQKEISEEQQKAPFRPWHKNFQ